MSVYPQRLGEPGYDDLRLLARLPDHRRYASGRVSPSGGIVDASVAALLIAKGGELVVDGAPSDESFLLIELDAQGEVIDDWVELSIEEAKQHGERLANTNLTWEAVPDVPDVLSWVVSRISC